MNDTQKLYPQLIYRINSKLSELKIASGIVKDANKNNTGGKDEQIIAPSVFNPYGRNFHWLVVADDKWQFSERSDGWSVNIKAHIQNNKEKWKELKKKKYATTEDKIEIKSIEDAFNILDNTAAENKDEYYHALLTVFQFYPVASHKYIDGIIYRNLKRLAEERVDKALSTHKIDYAIANLLIFDEKKTGTLGFEDTYKLYPWAEVKFHCGSSIETKNSCQEDNSPWYPEILPNIEPNSVPPIIKNKEYYERNRPEQFKDAEKFPLTPADEIKDSFYYNYFLPFFAGYEDFKTEAFLELKPKHFNKFKHILIAPLYDAYIDGKYYGNLCGTLQIPFQVSDDLKTFVTDQKHTKLISNSHLLTGEIKESAIFEVLQQQIGDNTDLLEHFIKYITLVQDWERIMVWKKNGSSFELDYCYKRDKENKWDRCIDVNNNAKCKGCKPNFEALKGWIQNVENKHLPIAENGFKNKNAKRKVSIENIFNKNLIPELYDDVINKHQNTRLIFEYPCYTVFPDNEEKDHKLGLHYERQQIDILRQMALQLKVKRETAKHGTKAAMTAIMSRNISHNIGSHVISYWNTELLENLKPVESKADEKYTKEHELIKSSKELFQYIQHRQDFVAELATSIPCSEMSLDLTNDIFGPFISPNNDKYASGKDSKGDECISAMLGYIASSEGINMHNKINLKVDTSIKNTRASIPNGLVGVHAVYSILENFIRNAAKHCKKPIKYDTPMIKIVVTEPENWKDDYLAVTLWDWREKSCEKATIESYINYLPGGGECYFSTTDGNLRSGGWGIKEMLASANFLRKKTPEDLYKYINNPNEYKNEPPLLEAICDNYANCHNNEQCNCTQHKNKEYKGKFEVRFYLRKPKDLAIISTQTDFKFNNGIVNNSIFAIKQFNNYEDHAKEISSYNMVLCENELIQKLHDDPAAPCRVKSCTVKMRQEKAKATDSNMEYLRLYEEFIKTTFNVPAEEKLILPFYSPWGGEIKKVLDAFFKYTEKDNGKFLGHLNNPRNVEDGVRRLLQGEYIQPVSGGYSTKTKLENIENINNVNIQRQVLLELSEAVLVEVLIVDERISDWANKEFTQFKPTKNNDGFRKLTRKEVSCVVFNKDILNGMKIRVIDVDKNNITYDDLKGKLKSYLKHKEGNNSNDKLPMFFVIHQGVLDKLKGMDKDKELVRCINCRWQVIDSGRGVPEKEKLDRYPNARFVQISALQKLLENFDKHALVQTLFSTRRPRIEEVKIEPNYQ